MKIGKLSGPLTAVSFLAGLGTAMKVAKDPFPRPGSTAEQIRNYFRGSSTAARISVTGQLTSVASLGRFTGSVVGLATRSGSRTLEATALGGGVLAAASLATSAALTTALTTKDHSDETTHTLSRLSFLAGGPVHGVGYGLLIGALGLAGRKTGEVPSWVTGASLVSAAAGITSPLYLKWEPAGWLIPIGRFSGFLIGAITGPKLTG
jgi:hypothetical protein